jgi:hypothetical protein
MVRQVAAREQASEQVVGGAMVLIGIYFFTSFYTFLT